MDTIRNQTYHLMSNPTAISQALIGLTGVILLYYTFHDKDESKESSEATSDTGSLFGMGAEDKPTEEKPAEGGLFGMGSEEKSKEEGGEEGGLFGTGAEEKPEAEKPKEEGGEKGGLFGTGAEEKPEEKKETVGGKKKKTRRDRKRNKKTAKHKK